MSMKVLAPGVAVKVTVVREPKVRTPDTSADWSVRSSSMR
ncbi:Uncharacterised protein [Mycobacteroides abscessus subsp. abscessus]|nr:Uncharacterised protein [Mycobacteroides abscessus subsp. abscessus]